jgi:hypothetical protein
MTESDWWALCDLDPAAFPWPYFADFLEERRDSRADAAREVGRLGWVPRRSLALHIWDWWRDGSGLPGGPDDLPADVFFRLADSDECYSDKSSWRSYRSPSAACRALLDALHKQGFGQKG